MSHKTQTSVSSEWAPTVRHTQTSSLMSTVSSSSRCDENTRIHANKLYMSNDSMATVVNAGKHEDLTFEVSPNDFF